jgi:hypothetical protein
VLYRSTFGNDNLLLMAKEIEKFAVQLVHTRMEKIQACGCVTLNMDTFISVSIFSTNFLVYKNNSLYLPIDYCCLHNLHADYSSI